MKYKDPAEVDCPACSTHQFQAVADLLELRAVCTRCGASLAKIGQKMNRMMAEVCKQIAYVVEPIMFLEDEWRVNLPEQPSWNEIRTKADFVRVIASYLATVAPDKADPTAIARAYDEALTRRGTPLPASDETPLFDLSGP